MRSIGSDQRPENGTDTARGPSLSPSSLPSSPTQQPPAAHQDRTPATVAAERKIAVLGPTLSFKGDLSAEEDFILQGRIQGSIHHTQRIIIGTGGTVVGNIYARVVVVDGNVDGDLHGMESVVVHETGRVAGNIFAPRVGIADGAFFNGRVDMSGGSMVSQGINQGVSQSAGNPVPRRRVEGPAMSPGLPMSAEETEKVLAPKVMVLPPPPSREKTG
jgi:cytoskeletal protein CcmA (bactofilin family)